MLLAIELRSCKKLLRKTIAMKYVEKTDRQTGAAGKKINLASLTLYSL